MLCEGLALLCQSAGLAWGCETEEGSTAEAETDEERPLTKLVDLPEKPDPKDESQLGVSPVTD